MQPQNSCRQNCKTLLTEEVRNTIFIEFWKIDNHDTKAANKKEKFVSFIEFNATQVPTFL
jgi:hypothetical protein